MPRHRTRAMLEGFTLLEIMVVVAIIAIIGSIVAPNLNHAQGTAEVAKSVAQMKEMGGALENYWSDHHAYPPFSDFIPRMAGMNFATYMVGNPVTGNVNFPNYVYYPPATGSNTYTICTDSYIALGRDMSNILKSDGSSLNSSTFYGLCFSPIAGIWAQ